LRRDGRKAGRRGDRRSALTRGSKGSSLYTRDQTSDHSGYLAEIVDTVGAGDAFTAALAMGLLHGDSLDRINDHANRIASYVCSQPGAMPRIPAELARAS
jgi:fructokinase